MPLWGLRASHRGRHWLGTAIHFLVLTVLTFLVLGPVICHRLLYSYFYVRRWHLDRMSQDFLYQNLEDAHNAVQYFANFHLPANSTPVVVVDGPRHAVAKPWLVITIVTIGRKPEFHYLLQVVSRFHRLLAECGDACRHHQLFLCNVDPNPRTHEDAMLLAKFIPSVEHYDIVSENLGTNLFEKEKQDYAFCLERTLMTFDPEYVLMVEDDAVPLPDIFPVLNQLLCVRFPDTPLGGALYFKLFHPERLQRYVNPEPMRILEWVGLGMFAGTILSWTYGRAVEQPGPSWPTFVFFALYSMGLVELVGRHYLLELRRLSPALYNVVPVTECCTPAMLYSSDSAHRVLAYFAKTECRRGFAKDTALYYLLRHSREWAFVVEPNLVQHVGLYSSLRGDFDEPKLL
ncbi:post-GPI attachment to proteins factor 4-like [Pleurodeles waltl]|uniref:post-GPI attachment to proteins factor 4-like n=1 Tax=Pleurodeles waltl TaxID=8319 RepID=UPI003709B783